MEKLTGEQIIKIIVDNVSKEDFGYMYYDSEALGLGEVEEVQQEGGEDEGSRWNSVQYFKDHDVYVQIDGYYQSHHGTDFYDDPYEVVPTEMTVVKFKMKN